jgi:hypothetical protein
LAQRTSVLVNGRDTRRKGQVRTPQEGVLRAGGTTQVVEHMPSKHKHLSSSKKKKKKKERKKERKRKEKKKK